MLMRKSQRRSLILASFTLVITITLVPTAGGAPPLSLSLGPVGAAIEDNGNLVLAVALRNDQKSPVKRVTVESIDVRPLRWSPSMKLPITFALINPGESQVLHATLYVSGSKSNVILDRYTIRISGTYRESGKIRTFRISQNFRPADLPGKQAAKKTVVRTRTVTGGRFKPLPTTRQTYQVEAEVAPLPHGAGFKGPRPETSATSLSTPKSPTSQLEKISFDGPTMLMQRENDPVVFRSQKIVGRPSSFQRPPEPTGATSYSMQSPPLVENVVFVAGNTSAAFSLDGGSSFTTLDPTRVFDFRDSSGNPIDGNGLCCDQVVQYIPSINRYVWVMMTVNRGAGPVSIGPNRLRVAVASPQDIAASGGTRWGFFDLTPSTFGWANTRHFDFPDIAYGDSYLYVSGSVIESSRVDPMTARGLMVARIPLAAVRDVTLPMTMEFVEPEFSSRAFGNRLVQISGDTAFWAAHVTDSRVRIYSWPDSSTTARQRDVMIHTWSASDYSSLDPDTREWLPSRPKIVGGTRRSGVGRPGDRPREVWFAWTAGRDSFFPQPWVNVLRVDASDSSYISELPIWNPGYAFAYPSLTINAENEVGIAAAWGGAGVNYGNTAVGILGDFVLWITGVSDMSARVRARRGTDIVNVPVFGDYLTVRTHVPDNFLYAGYTYQVKRDGTNPGLCDAAINSCRFDVIFTLFGRRSRVGP